MSMNGSFVYGYGFNCECDNKKLIEFVKIHKETFCESDMEVELYEEMLEYAEYGDDLEDFFDGYSCESSDMEGNGAVISNIMSRETGIRFKYCQPDGDCDTYAAVVFKENYPWELNDTEKNLTEEKLQIICKKYMDELGIDIEPCYLSLEYYG